MKNRQFGFILFYFLISLHSSALHPKPLVIVNNHKPKAVIVLPDSTNKQLKNSATILQNYILQSTDALLPITTQANRRFISIHIGATSYVKSKRISIKNLDEDGFILQQLDDNNFIIIGGSDWGTEFGVYSFLERYVGVVWLMPTTIGADIPKQATIKLPGKKVIDSPAFLSREVSPLYVLNKDAQPDWARFNRLRGRIAFHHNLLNLVDPKQFFKNNPEFYPKKKDQKEILEGYKWQPNFSAPGIVDSASRKIVEYFYRNPTIKSYSLGINDVTDFDQSPASLARRNGRKNFLGFEDVSDDYFKWVNEVVEKVATIYPTKKFGLLAYINVASPPSPKIGVHRSVIPFLCYERMRWADVSLSNQGQQLTKEWGKMCSSLGWYDYAYGLDYLVPRVWFHTMQQYLKWGHQHRVKYYYAELYPNWGEGPKSWILGKLLWNPNQNVDSLLNIWYERTAGKIAAPKLKEFYATWEDFWTRDIFKSKWNHSKNTYLPYFDLSYLDDVPNEYIRRSDLLMEEAYNLAGTPIQKARVSKLREMWRLYKIAADTYRNASGSANKKQVALRTSPQLQNYLNTLKSDTLFAPSIERILLSISRNEDN